jgi:hypothetical protein
MNRLTVNLGPGQSTEDVKWLDQKLAEFFKDETVTEKMTELKLSGPK